MRNPSHYTRKTICPTCRREIRVTIPAGGSGDVDVYYRHDRPGTKERCEESRQIVHTPVYQG